MPLLKDEFDLGALSWVKSEIEGALACADEGIRRFVVNPDDRDIALRTQSHLHQVSGALRMVGLESVARVSGAVEKLVETLGRREIKMSDEVTNAVRRAIAALSEYLDGLLRGRPNRPLVLYPAYRAVLGATGSDNVSELDLFYPNLAQRPTFSEGAAPRTGVELVTLLTLKRAEFQRGLVNLLRGKDFRPALRAMLATLVTIEAIQTEQTRILWWIAVGFLDGLADSPTAPDPVQKRLCARIDLQIERCAKGADPPPERLMRELLFAIAHMRPTTERIRDIQEAYCLASLLPQAATSGEDARTRLLLGSVREQAQIVDETWLRLTTGNRSSLADFGEQTVKLNRLAQSLSNRSLRTIFTKLAEVGSNLNANPRRPDEAVALETATALLVARAALDNYDQLDPSFTQVAHTTIVRLTAALRRRPLPGSSAKQLAEVFWPAEERQLFFQLGQEILTNLNHIEQVLDAFFQDPTKRADLATLPGHMNPVQGALAMLESEDAVSLLRAAQALVQKLAASWGPADPHDAELTAEAFGSLGLFIWALQRGRENPHELLHPVLARFGIVPRQPKRQPIPVWKSVMTPSLTSTTWTDDR